MMKKLITSIILLSFITQSVGANSLVIPAQAGIHKHTLRPASTGAVCASEGTALLKPIEPQISADNYVPEDELMDKQPQRNRRNIILRIVGLVLILSPILYNLSYRISVTVLDLFYTAKARILERASTPFSIKDAVFLKAVVCVMLVWLILKLFKIKPLNTIIRNITEKAKTYGLEMDKEEQEACSLSAGIFATINRAGDIILKGGSLSLALRYNSIILWVIAGINLIFSGGFIRWVTMRFKYLITKNPTYLRIAKHCWIPFVGSLVPLRIMGASFRVLLKWFVIDPMKKHPNRFIVISIILAAGFAAGANFCFPVVLSAVPYYINMMIYFGLGEFFSQAFNYLKGRQKEFDYKKIAIAVLGYGLFFGITWQWLYNAYKAFIPNNSLAGRWFRVFTDQTSGAMYCTIWIFFISGFYDKLKGQAFKIKELTLKSLRKVSTEIWHEKKGNLAIATLMCWFIWIPIQYFNLNREADSSEMVSAISVIEMPWSILWVLLANIKKSTGHFGNFPRIITSFSMGVFVGFYAFHIGLLHCILGVANPALLVLVPAFGLAGVMIANWKSKDLNLPIETDLMPEKDIGVPADDTKELNTEIVRNELAESLRDGEKNQNPKSSSSGEPFSEEPRAMARGFAGNSLDLLALVQRIRSGYVQSYSGIRYDSMGLAPEIAAEDEVVASAYAYNYTEFIMHKNWSKDAYKIVIARDPRPTSEAIVRAKVRGIMKASEIIKKDVRIIYLDVATTPLLESAVRTFDADGGIMITASHNPLEWNGWKYTTANREHGNSLVERGALLNDTQMKGLIEAANKIVLDVCLSNIKVSRFSSDINESMINRMLQARAGEYYEKAIDGYSKELAATLRQVDPDLVLIADANGGSAGRVAPDVLNKLRCANITCINTELGKPAHKIEPVKENLGEDGNRPEYNALLDIVRAVKIYGAKIGLVFDFDADRGNIVLLMPDGSVKDVDPQSLSALVVYIELQRNQGYDKDRFPKGLAVVGHCGNSFRTKKIAMDMGASFSTAETGEINIRTKMNELENEGYFVPIGVEGYSGGTIYRNSGCRDGLQVLLSIAGALSTMAGKDTYVAELLDKLPEFTSMQFNINISDLSQLSVKTEMERRLKKIVTKVGENYKIDGIDNKVFKQVIIEYISKTRLRQKSIEDTAGAGLDGDYIYGGWRVRMIGHDGIESIIWVRGAKTEKGLYRALCDAPTREEAYALKNILTTLCKEAPVLKASSAGKTIKVKINDTLRVSVRKCIADKFPELPIVTPGEGRPSNAYLIPLHGGGMRVYPARIFFDKVYSAVPEKAFSLANSGWQAEISAKWGNGKFVRGNNLLRLDRALCRRIWQKLPSEVYIYAGEDFDGKHFDGEYFDIWPAGNDLISVAYMESIYRQDILGDSLRSAYKHRGRLPAVQAGFTRSQPLAADGVRAEQVTLLNISKAA